MSKLITYAYLKEETDISSVIDNEKLDNPIKRAQERLSAIIGSLFYDEIESQYTPALTGFSTANLALYNPYIKKYLAWQAYYLYLSKANTYETRTGVRVFLEENSEPASDKAIGEQLANAKQDLQIHKDNLINFLNSAQRVSSSAYPLYTATCGSAAGSSFGITAVKKISTVNAQINSKIRNQEP